MSARTVSPRWFIPLVVVIASLLVSAPVLAQDASPEPSVAPASSAPASAPAVRPLAIETIGPLPAGRYSDTSTGLAIEFDLGDGWLLDGEPIPDVGFALVREGEGDPYFAIVPFDGTVFNHPCFAAENEATFGHAAESIEATPAGFIEHVSAHPFVSASEPAPVAYAGLPGLAIDVTVDVPDACDPPWAWLWALPVVGDYHLEDGQTSRLVALQADDTVLVISSEVYEGGDFAEFIELTDGILRSLEVADMS